LSHGYTPVRKLAATDQVDGFDCGQAALNQFLQRYALVNQKANSAQTYVCCHPGSAPGPGASEKPGQCLLRASAPGLIH